MPQLIFAAGEAPVPKDVVTAILGAAAGVGGLILVFLGVVLSTISAFPGDSPSEVVEPFRRAAWLATAVFALALVCVAVSLFWLAIADVRGLYYAAIVVFAALLVAALLLSVGVVREVV